MIKRDIRRPTFLFTCYSKSLLFSLVVLCACELHSTSNNAVSKSIAATKKVAVTTRSPALQKTTLASHHENQPATSTWRDRFNGQLYPLPDTIGSKPVAFYLQHPKVSPLAKALYTAHFRPTDNDSTVQLLALTTTDNKEIRPFYRWCLDFTIAISDGALGEYPGTPALAYASKFPQEFFAYMDKDKTGERYRRWVEIIAYSGLNDYNKPASKIQRAIISKMTKRCLICDPKTAKRIVDFASDVTAASQNN